MAAASSPHDLETHYRQLLDLLDAPVSGRWTLVQVDRFLDRIDVRRAEAESYLLPLVEPLAETVDGLDPVGLSPGCVERLATVLRTAQAHRTALRTLDAAAQAEQALRRRAALLYAYAGAVGRARSCLAPERDGGPLEETLEASRPDERLRAARSAVDDPELGTELAWIARHWTQEEERHGTGLPVVERLPSWIDAARPENGPVGALRRVGVELYGPSDTTDRLQVDVVVHGADEVDVTAVPLTAARRLLDDRHPRLQGRYVQGRLAFDRQHLEHGGRSAGLAIAALFYGAVLDHTHRRRRLHLRPSVALTGAVTAEGDVESVEAEALATKVRTVFFSPKTTLVVPEAQRAAAEDTRDALLADFPHGALDVVGADRLDAVFYDRRLTAQERIGWVRHAAQRLWHRRGRVVAGTVIAVLLLIIGRLLYGPIDKNPVAVRFAGTEMIVKNESGQVLERIPVGESTVQSARTGNYRAYRLGDIDGTGRNEICWARRNSGQQGDTPQLQCKGVGEDTLRWRLETRFEAPFPRKPAVTTKGFGTDHIRIGDFDANGRTEMIVTLRHNKYFPYLVLKLDADTGRELGRYVHAGYFFSRPLIADLNDDGVEEILLAGMNNAYNQAVFTVLDSRYIGGHGPTRRDYVVRDADPAREVAYLRIPPTVVDRAQPWTVNKGSEIVYYKTKKRILVGVWDGRHPGREERGARVLVQLNEHFRPVAIGTASQYDRLAEHLVETGRIEEVPDYEYFQQYKQQFLYWTGSDWTRKPTINARWRVASGTAWRPDSAKTEARGEAVRDSASR